MHASFVFHIFFFREGITRWGNPKGDFGSSCKTQGGLKDWVAQCWIVLLFLLWQTRKSKFASIVWCDITLKLKETGGGISCSQTEQVEEMVVKVKVEVLWMRLQCIWWALLWCDCSCKNGSAGSWYLHVYSVSYTEGSVLQTVHSCQLHMESGFSHFPFVSVFLLFI